MKKMKDLKKLFATAVIAVFAIGTSFGQADLGASCGCPPVASRTPVNLSTLTNNAGGIHDGEFTSLNVHLDCMHKWIIDKKIFVPKGGILTVDPGAVLMGVYTTQAQASTAAALTVEKGAKMYAVGTESCPIVMTSVNDPMDGSYAAKNICQWGGLVIAGYGINNLTLAKNGPFQAGTGDGKICIEDGVGTFEGFATSDQRDEFGAKQSIGEVPDDHDNSGIYRYLSVRHTGAILQVGGEINGISLGSVGDGTIMDHIEVVSCGDDNMEFWGGTVNVKYASFLWGNDDMFDFDDGYRGKAQFIFSCKSATSDTTVVSKDADNGFEADADDQQSGLYPRSHPIFYNITMIHNNKHVMTSDNTGMAAIMAKELTEGEWYNGIYANWNVGLNLWTGNKPGEGTRVLTAGGTYGGGANVLDAYDNWTNDFLKVKNNTFIHTLAPLALDCHKKITTYIADSYIGNPAAHAPSASDQTKFTNDGNTAVSDVPGFVWNWSMDGNTSNVVTTPLNPVPTTDIASSITAPQDGFFTPVSYRGAFKAGEKSWLSGWTYSTLLQNISGLQTCYTDINGDGKTDNVDFLQLLGKFNQNCK